MKKTMKYLSMIALALVGAVMIGCSSDDDNIDTPKQPENKDNNVVTLTTTIGRDNSAGAKTRALAPTGEKTFAVGEQIAIVYQNTSSQTVKGVSAALTASDILESGKKANFTFTLESPDRTKNVTYIYPAAMAKADGTVNNANLYNTQDGTLTYISSNLDLATYTGPWLNEKSLPVGALSNQLAILSLALKKNYDETKSLTSSITGFTLSDGTHTYNITREAGPGPIYVAMLPTSNATIEVTATNGKGRIYSKSLTGKTYAANNGYTLAWKMTEYIKGQFSVGSDKKVYFSTSNLNATKKDNGSTWSWHFVDTQYARVGGQDKDGNGTLTGNNYINGDGSVTDAGYGKNIDLFGWSTSATHLGINISDQNATYDGAFADWGSAPEVTACIGTGWRTLNKDEWRYLMVTRAGNRYAKARINDSRNGFILLPDNWNTNNYTLNNINNDKVDFSVNNITDADWTSKLEANGAVFLPVTGQRNSGNKVNNPDTELHYWSSSGGINPSQEPIGYHLRYINSGDNHGLAPDAGAGRCNGFSVRLVRDVE